MIISIYYFLNKGYEDTNHFPQLVRPWKLLAGTLHDLIYVLLAKIAIAQLRISYKRLLV